MPTEREKELQRRVEQQDATLRQIEHDRIMKEAHDHEVRQEAMAATRKREQNEAIAAEIEAQRKSSWHLHLTDPSNGPAMQKMMEEQFNPILLAARIPPSGWPAGDGPDKYQYRAGPLPVANDASTPALVLKAQAMLAQRR
jgi:hypothetical protein